MTIPSAAYAAGVAAGEWQADPAQQALLPELDARVARDELALRVLLALERVAQELGLVLTADDRRDRRGLRPANGRIEPHRLGRWRTHADGPRQVHAVSVVHAAKVQHHEVARGQPPLARTGMREGRSRAGSDNRIKSWTGEAGAPHAGFEREGNFGLGHPYVQLGQHAFEHRRQPPRRVPGLVDDLGRVQVAREAELTRGAERAADRAPGLARDAQRAAVCLGDIDHLDFMALAALIARRRSLEERAEQLRQKKSSMPQEAWEREFEQLMIELARVSHRIRAGS